MEHLRDEYNSFAFDDKVILYCDPHHPAFPNLERTFNHFLQLPHLLGWNLQVHGNNEMANGLVRLNLIVQRWLYFEVLAQVFGHLDGYKPEDFIKMDTSGQSYINTRKLPSYIGRWLDSEKESSAIERSRRLIRIYQVLEKARWYVSKHCTVPKLGDSPIWEIDELLALSVLVLGETLTRAQHLIQKKVGFHINGWCSHDLHNQGWGYSKLILQKLNDELWCAKAINMFQALSRRNTIGLTYLYTLRQGSLKGPDHKFCTPTECREDEMRRKYDEPVDPVPYHHCGVRSDFCSENESEYVKPGQTAKVPLCTTVEGFNGYIEGRKLAAIFDEDKIPLFRFHKVDRRLEVVEMGQSFDQSYAIFSHVWKDGFGSIGERNQMSLCVLNMIYKILEQITIQWAGVKAPLSELFWIDTLAIPVSKPFVEQRTKAIRQMHQIYTHAKYTIVLDKSLMQVNMGSGYSNPAMKITMSRWMTRLWTLQEAVLSKNLLFYFKDRIYSMSHLEEMFAKEDSRLHSCIPSLSRIYYNGILGDIRPKLHEEFRKDEGWKPRSDFLAAVWKAAQWRSTAHPIHEMLSLATILNTNLQFYARPCKAPEDSRQYEQECDRRMIQLLLDFAAQSPCPIPPGMIFLPGPKLSRKGYSWAPKTWLSSREIDSPDPLSLRNVGNARLNISEGLEVQFPGFMLHDLGDSRETLHTRNCFYFSANFKLLDWYRVEPAKDTRQFPGAEILAKRQLAMILPRLPLQDKEVALFVAVSRTWSGIHYAEILTRVWVSREDRQSELQKWGDLHREGFSEAMTVGEQLPETERWCVDGPTTLNERDQVEDGELPTNFGQANDQRNGPGVPKPLRTRTWDSIKQGSTKIFSWRKS